MFSTLSARLAALRHRLAEPHRAYHAQSHIDAMLAAQQTLAATIANPAAMELATWYHDAIYDPAAHDNEARSEALLRAELEGLAAPAILEPAAAMIRATATHALPDDLPEPWRADTALFLDLDLAILAAPPAEYDAYEAGIAAEFIPVHGEAAYRAGRAAFLRSLLARPRLFLTDRFHAERDAPARANIRRALEAPAGPAPVAPTTGATPLPPAA